ncbi:DMBT1-like protein, partial [Mya arenaria]
NENKLERFLSLADRNVSEMMLEADNMFSLIRTNIVEIPNQISDLSMELQLLNKKELSSIRHEVKELVNRVDMLENNTVTHDPSSLSQDMYSTSYNVVDETGENGKQLVHDEINEAKLQATKNDIKAIDERLGNTIESNVSELEKEIASLKECIYKKITHDGYYYPCEKNVRLANASFYGSKGVQGRLEVNHDNNWETVCDDSFQYATESYNTNNVDVVCRMFRFRECKYVVEAGLGKGSGDIWMDHVICGGGESSFLECPQIGWCVHDCGHGEDVGFRMWN